MEETAMTKRNVLLGAVALVGALSMVAPVEAKTTLHLLTAQPAEELQPVVKAFEAANPDIKIETETVPYENYAAQIASRMGSKDPTLEVYFVDAPQVPAMASKGWLVNFDDQKGDIEAATNPRARPALVYKGSYWALPYTTSVQLLFYNKDLLAKAGIPTPSAAEADRPTWEHVVELATKAQAAGAKWGLQLEQNGRYYQSQAIFESAHAGSGLMGDDLLTPAVNTDKWIATATWYQSIFNDGVAPRNIAAEQQNDIFRNGQAAFFWGGTWNLARFNTTPGLNYGVVASPYFASGKPATPTDAWDIGVSPYAGNIDAARKFALYMTLGDGVKYSAQGAHIPLNSAAYEDYMRIAKDAAVGNEAKSIVDTAKTVISYELKDAVVSRPRSIGFVILDDVMARTFLDIQGGADVKATLDGAEVDLKSSFSRL
jgi:ABC-type glycerol-3-phosphate transport system substrate-binding protein